MKAGTAQKMVLNMLTTGAMIKIGKTYENFMIDLKANNEKLKDRAIRIVSQIAEVSHSEALAALLKCDWEIKTAITMIKMKLVPQRGCRVENFCAFSGVSGRLASWQ